MFYAPGVSSDLTLSTASRLWFAFICFWRMLFDGALATRVLRVAGDVGAADDAPVPRTQPSPGASNATAKTEDALQLLALFQREGRLVDFLEQDVASFSDAEVGAAARVVHEGCRRALRAHAKVLPVRTEEEGARVTVASGFRADEIKLTGNVAGDAPFHGVLRHRGWKVEDLALPTMVREADAHIVAPAEVEL